ncbi:tagaturonate epimerase family protein [Verrucomicrobiales bacterium]|nr:tagaturonate epimerase family protein [Verrucomicrobiales bacterium]
MLIIGKYSFGMGDRFAHQGVAQLRACALAKSELGVDIVPVWNKSHREHTTIGSEPISTRIAADAAVAELKWTAPHFVDADHINLDTVDHYTGFADFFTIDVADSIGEQPNPESVAVFIEKHPELVEEFGKDTVQACANQFLLAVQKAGEIYRHIKEAKGGDNFVTEVSMDETDSPQTPPELLIILAAIADEEIPVQTIAPKFTGRFNKGVDYVGDVEQFEKEFNDDLAVIKRAIAAYGLPENLKLSVHSGSDKFSIYGPISKALKETGAGIHLKTAGTTWLEELIGLAAAGGEGLQLAKDVYREALANAYALCAPYASVIDIDTAQLPSADEVDGWSSEQYQNSLRHDQSIAKFNPHVRQLLHVGYKVAARMGDRYLNLLKECEAVVAKNVTENLFERHLKRLF